MTPICEGKKEEDHWLKMNDADYLFYEHQKGKRVAKCPAVSKPITKSDFKFIERVYFQKNTQNEGQYALHL